MTHAEASAFGPETDAVGQAELIRAGEILTTELVEAAIDRIEKINPQVNAMASFDCSRAMDRARTLNTKSVFSGVPTLVKDVLPYPGHGLGFGSRLFAGMVAQEGSDYTEALDNSGLVVLGKSTTSEFALLGTTETLANGQTRNPWNLARSTGGSSGGAVAAVASGMVALAHSSDGGGSTRGPASFCGLFGFKPSRDRTVSNGLSAQMPTSRLISEHCVSRSVRDSAVWLSATERPGLDDGLSMSEALSLKPPQPLKIGFYTKDSRGIAPSADVHECILDTADLCTNLGHEVIEVQPPSFDVDTISDCYFKISALTMSGALESFENMMGDRFDKNRLEPFTRQLAERGAHIAPDFAAGALEHLAKAEREANRSFAECDILLSPTVPYTAFPLGVHTPETDYASLRQFIERVACYTFISSLAGWPAMSVPLGNDQTGMPIGSHFSAPPGEDRVLLSLAFQLETARPWQHKISQLWKANGWFNA